MYMSVQLSMYWKIEVKVKDIKKIKKNIYIIICHNFFFANGLKSNFWPSLISSNKVYLPLFQLTFKQQFC